MDRRNNLAKALVTDDIDAFIVEPGYFFKYVHLPFSFALPFHSLQILNLTSPVRQHLSTRLGTLGARRTALPNDNSTVY